MIDIYIRKELFGEGIEIVFGMTIDGKRYIAAPMQIEFKYHPEGEEMRPSLRLDHFIAPKFLKALAEALDQEGVKTDNDFKIQGKLEATKYHLEDLRTLLKLNKPITVKP